MKKSLIFVLTAVLFSASAQAAYIDGLIEEACKVVTKKNETVTCAARNAKIVNSAKADAKAITTAQYKALVKNGYNPVVTLDARDLGILPDADTSLIYGYNRFLRDEYGTVVGVLDISGYANSETGDKIQLNLWLNLQGQITRASVK